MFHAWGLTHLMMGLGRNATVVVSRRFDPAGTLELVDRHRARRPRRRAGDAAAHAGPAVPTSSSRFDTSTLDVIAVSGSALGGRLATEVLNRFGPVLYNTYGSTEVAVATIATPERPPPPPHHRRPPRRRACGSRSSTPTARPCPTGADRPRVRRRRRPLRRLHVGRRQGGAARPAVVGRHGPLRRRRPPLHRRPRRRHDRVGRRERVPGRGGGAPRPTTRRSPRWP